MYRTRLQESNQNLKHESQAKMDVVIASVTMYSGPRICTLWLSAIRCKISEQNTFFDLTPCSYIEQH